MGLSNSTPTLGKGSTADDILTVPAATEVLQNEFQIRLKDLKGKRAIVTGANTGIGKETARVLAIAGMEVIIACRSETRGLAARDELREVTGSDKIIFKSLDLGSLKSVKSFADDVLSEGTPLKLLINNAGVMAIPEYQETEDGVEMQWGVNHLGHFYLTDLLTPLLAEAGAARVVILSSRAHRRGPKKFMIQNVPDTPESYGSLSTYGMTKMCNLWHARQLNALYASRGQDITAYSVHPGVVATELVRQREWMTKLLPWVAFLLKTPSQGAATSLYCALRPEALQHAGDYFSDCTLGSKFSYWESDEFASQLWKKTVHVLASKGHQTQHSS
eukprot:GFYU01001616.1.p1 GENE.GFYU01001616.1~~GFYU01001616.1.p1  ORF type:complete len:332 (-),score=86.20 GFYU01001616.1:48-1043(-)